MTSGGRVIHTGQVVVDVTMRVEAMPATGAEVFADAFGLRIGGGFTVLHAVRQMGAEAVYRGAVGDGPLGRAAIRALDRRGIEFEGATVRGVDTGICVAVTDRNAERTFLSTRGAETMVPERAYASMELRPGDVVYMTGYSLMHEATRRALLGFARSRARDVHAALFDVSPMVGEIPREALEAVGLLHPIWSMNGRETRILADRMGLAAPARSGVDDLCRALAERLAAPVVCRVGAQGAWWSEGGPARRAASPSVRPVDTNGAGDAHSGVLCAALAEGEDLARSLRLANVAAALSTTQDGPATCPPRARILEVAGGADH